MSEFSHLLSEFIAAKSVGTYSMAQYCGIDRSTIYKIINGKRKPSSLDSVIRMARFMQLTPAERETLIEAYRISDVGADVYYRRKDMMDLLENFSYHEIVPLHLTFPAVEPDIDADVTPLHGTAQILPVLFSILSNESSRKNGHIELLIRPDFPYVMDLLRMSGQQNPSLEIRHIFCLNNTEELTRAKSNYNLVCLKRILPLYICGCRYQAYYYYDTIVSNPSGLRLFPYLIQTGNYAVLLSEDLEYAVLYRDRATREMLAGMFQNYLNDAELYLEKIDTVQKQMEYTTSIISNTSRSGMQFDFQLQPCLTPFFTDKMLEQYLAKELPDRERLLQGLKLYLKQIQKYMFGSPTVSIFSENGVRKFLLEGTLEEYPSDFYYIPAAKDRVSLVRQMLAAPENLKLRMLRREIGSIRNGLNILIHNYAGYLYFCSGNSSVFYLMIREPSLLTAFQDFFESMSDDLFYTDGEMRERIAMLIDECREANCCGSADESDDAITPPQKIFMTSQ